jgi:hypothetical protein
MSIRDELNQLDKGWDGSKADGSGRGAKIRKGTYFGVITNWETCELGKKKTLALKLEIEIIGRIISSIPPAKCTDESAGVHIKQTMFITENTLPYVARNLEVIGRPISKASEIPDLKFNGVQVKIGVDYIKDQDNKLKEWPDVVWIDKGFEKVPDLVPAEPVPATAATNGSAGAPVVAEDYIPF